MTAIFAFQLGDDDNCLIKILLCDVKTDDGVCNLAIFSERYDSFTASCVAFLDVIIPEYSHTHISRVCHAVGFQVCIAFSRAM
jgi:hypothetical protein